MCSDPAIFISRLAYMDIFFIAEQRTKEIGVRKVLGIYFQYCLFTFFKLYKRILTRLLSRSRLPGMQFTNGSRALPTI